MMFLSLQSIPGLAPPEADDGAPMSKTAKKRALAKKKKAEREAAAAAEAGLPAPGPGMFSKIGLLVKT